MMDLGSKGLISGLVSCEVTLITKGKAKTAQQRVTKFHVDKNYNMLMTIFGGSDADRKEWGANPFMSFEPFFLPDLLLAVRMSRGVALSIIRGIKDVPNFDKTMQKSAVRALRNGSSRRDWDVLSRRQEVGCPGHCPRRGRDDPCGGVENGQETMKTFETHGHTFVNVVCVKRFHHVGKPVLYRGGCWVIQAISGDWVTVLRYADSVAMSWAYAATCRAIATAQGKHR